MRFLILEQCCARSAHCLFPYNQQFIMTVLADIVAATRRRVAECRSTADFRDLEKRAAAHVPRGFRKALESAGQTGTAIIAELKKASPSRGLIRSDFNPAALAKE